MLFHSVLLIHWWYNANECVLPPIEHVNQLGVISSNKLLMVFCVHHYTWCIFSSQWERSWVFKLNNFGFDQIDDLSDLKPKCFFPVQFIKWMKRLFVLELNCHFSCPPDCVIAGFFVCLFLKHCQFHYFCAWEREKKTDCGA